MQDNSLIVEEIKNLGDKKFFEFCERLVSQDILQVIACAGKEVLNDITYSLSFYMLKKQSEKAFRALEKVCLGDEIDIEVKLYIYRQLLGLKFRGEIPWQVSEKIYYHILDKISKICDMKQYKYINKENRNKNRVVFITDQFLGYQHSPTKVLLNMVKALDNKFGNINEVYIYNSTLLPIQEECLFYRPFTANYIKYTDKLLEVTLSKVGITRCGIGYEEKNEIDVISRIIGMVKSINDINPQMVIGVGGDNILADLCNCFTDVYICGLTKLTPRSCARYLINMTPTKQPVQYKLSETQQKIEVPFSVSDLEDITNEINTRESLGLPQQDFLISVVGNRLGVEITKEFIHLCERILVENPNAGIVFIGDYDKENLKSEVDQTIYDRLYSIGYRSNLIQAVGLTNLFLNPYRQGGGYGGYAAIQNSIPIVSRDFGDVSAYLPDSLKVKNYTELGKLVDNMIRNQNVYQQAENEIKATYEAYKGNTWEKLFKHIFSQ